MFSKRADIPVEEKGAVNGAANGYKKPIKDETNRLLPGFELAIKKPVYNLQTGPSRYFRFKNDYGVNCSFARYQLHSWCSCTSRYQASN